MSKNAVILLFIFILGVNFAGELISKGLASPYRREKWTGDSNITVDGGYLLARQSSFIVSENNSAALQRKQVKVIITAYSSSIEETDDTPFITASGSYVRYGVAAANFLPIGTMIRLPKIFGDKVFIVEDRLNSRYEKRVDIWMPSREKAKDFGLRFGEVEIL